MAKAKKKAAKKRVRKVPKVSAAALKSYKAKKTQLKKAMYAGKPSRVVVG